MTFTKYLTIKKNFKNIFHNNFDALMHKHSLKSLITIDLRADFTYKHDVTRTINFAPMYLTSPTISREVIVSTTPYGILIMRLNIAVYASSYELALTFH